MVRPVEDDEREDDAPASRSTAGGSVGQLAAEIGAKSLRKLGLGNLSPDAVRQLASVIDSVGQKASAAKPRDRWAVAWVITAVTVVVLGLVLLIAIGAASFAGLRVADGLRASDERQTERVVALEARLADSEARRLEHQAKLDQILVDADKEADVVALDLELVKERQTALVVYLLAAQVKLAKAQGVELPDPPPVLRIAQAEATLGRK